MVRALILSIFVISCFGVSCQDDKDDSRKLIIMTGQLCGWCSGGDSLAIASLKSVYEFTGACGEPDKSIIENTQVEQWRDLRTSLNWNDFKNVNVNTCAVCADGCDTWIRIHNGSESHYIRFTESSPETEPISIFVEKLKTLHEKFRQK